jgi:hypothetical protein
VNNDPSTHSSNTQTSSAQTSVSQTPETGLSGRESDKSQKKAIKTTRRLFVLLLAGALILSVSFIATFIYYAKPASQFLVNRLIASQGITVLDYQDNNSGLHQLDLAYLKLDYQGTLIDIKGLSLSLTDTLALIKRGKLLASDLQGIAIEQLDIKPSPALVKQLLIGSRQQQENLPFDLAQLQHWHQTLLLPFLIKANQDPLLTPQNMTLDIPNVYLGDVTLSLPEFSAKTEKKQGHKLSFSAAKLSKQGQVETLISFDKHPLINLSVHINPMALTEPWQISTALTLEDSVQGLRALTDYLDVSRQALGLPRSALHQGTNALMASFANIENHGVIIKGSLATQTSINPVSLALNSQFELSDLVLGAQITPNDDYNDNDNDNDNDSNINAPEFGSAKPALQPHSLPHSQQKVTLQHLKSIKLSLELDNEALALSLSPLSLSFQLNNAQRQALEALFLTENNSPAKKGIAAMPARFSAWFDALTADQQALTSISLNTQASELKIDLKNPQLVSAGIEQAQLTLSVTAGAHQQALKLTNLQLSQQLVALSPNTETKTQAVTQPETQSNKPQSAIVGRQFQTLAQLDVSKVTANTLSVTADYDWFVSQKAPLTVTPTLELATQTSKAKTAQENTENTRLSAGTIQAKFAGSISRTPSTQQTLITLAPKSYIELNDLTGNSPRQQWQLGQWRLTVDDTGQWHEQRSKSAITVPAFTTKVNNLTLTSNRVEAGGIDVTASSVSLTSAQNNQFDLPHPLTKPLTKPIAQTLTPTFDKAVSAKTAQIIDWRAWRQQLHLQSQLTWQVKGLDVRRQAKASQANKSRPLALLVLDKLSLEQDLDFNKGLISSQDTWLLDGLASKSQHKLDVSRLPNHIILAGQWQLKAPLAQFIAASKKTFPLPVNILLDGQSELEASYVYQHIEAPSLSMSKATSKQQSQNTAQETSFPRNEPSDQLQLKVSTQLSQLTGDYLDYGFTGGKLSISCQYDWQSSQSQLVCPETELTLTQAKLGLSFDNLYVKGQLQLNKDNSKPASNWLQSVTGLSSSDVKLTAQGDFLDGRFLIPDFSLRVQDISSGYILLQGVSLEALMAAQPQVGVKASGIFDGVLPATFSQGEFVIKGGQLAARAPGGHIQVAGNPAMAELEQMQPHLTLVFTALEDLNYQQLTGNFDMTAKGDANINIMVKGRSEGIERPIHLNYSHEENLLQLYRSLQLTNQLQDNIEQSVK